MYYSTERKRDYNFLVSKLKQKNLRLEKNLFVAVLNVITNCDELGFTKSKAIKMSATQNKVTQKAIKETLKEIEYVTPNEAKKILKTNSYYESKTLSNLLEKGD